MPNNLLDLLSDPWANDTYPEYPQILSTYYSGLYENIRVPSTPNYPPVTPSRYFINLPVTPYLGDTTTYPIVLRDVTNSVNLTDTAGSPGVNQYRYAPSTSITPNKIELNAAQSGVYIAYSYYGIGSIINNNWYSQNVSGNKTYTIATPSIYNINNKIKVIMNLQYPTFASENIYLKINGNTAYFYNKLYQNGSSLTASGSTGSGSIDLGIISENYGIIVEIEISINLLGDIIYKINSYNSYGAQIGYTSIINGKTYGVTYTDCNNITIFTNTYNFSGNIILGNI